MMLSFYWLILANEIEAKQFQFKMLKHWFWDRIIKRTHEITAYLFSVMILEEPVEV